ncbi:VCBS repeat-containing protein [Dinghuibacter silviterrae]|uniref:VCBS repeat protein n=1 Tax=Dinghuibacter silviterrae TaxID=1539049 RepID=A0A4R8DK80_9BACT|nr:VCBS repeat-containing protein [Dinghuibacter silviterrae]TDW97420.1 VCBS repeat protein [Dinghuibacter silviterrae]
MTSSVRHWTLLLLTGMVGACNTKPQTLFTDMPADYTHVDFRNDIKEDEDYNILTYEYLYNGAGVAVGDVNGDGLPDIFLVSNMGSCKLYLNKGHFQFEDVTDKAGVGGRNGWKTGAVMADVNGDGLLDIYLCHSGPGPDSMRRNELFINNGVHNGVPTFTESAEAYGLDAPGTFTTTVAFFDMDNDGDLDMFMVNHADMFFNPFFNTDKLRSTRNARFGNRLYRNDNGHFTDISDQAGIYGSGLNFGLSASIGDVNGDGWPDIYTTNDYDERDFLYLNNHDGTFREVLDKAAGHISEFSMGSDMADYNNDGWPDIAVLDMLPEDNHRQKMLRGPDGYDKYTMRVDHGLHHQQMRNTLQLNNGVDSTGMPIFSEIGQMAGISSTDWSWAPLFADFDNDGWKDLFVSNGILRDMTNMDFVKYTSGYSSGYNAKEANDKTAMWQLVQNMPSTPLQNYLFHNDHNLCFTDVTKDWGITQPGIHNGAAYVDLDGDGDLDLVINNLNGGVSIYRNNASELLHRHYLRIRLKGEGRNTYGIGAKVKVTTAHGTQFYEEYTCRGFQSSVDPVMHVGLGDDSLAEAVVVTWPGGKQSALSHVKGDTLLVIDEQGATTPAANQPNAAATHFRDVTAATGIKYVHQQSNTVDFKIAPLLPYQLSKVGPCLAKGDVNGDGLEDVFIGGSAGYDCKLYLQTKDGRFVEAPDQPWNADKSYTTTDALFFDADGDGAPDLYLVSGGADYPLGDKHYQDRFFENDGHGHFKEVVGALPPETVSGACVRAADVDHDGKPDLFVGGAVQPGLFPEAPESFVLKNVSQKGNIKFEKIQTLTPGMVADACWIDLNKDGWEDLVVVGPFMPITVLENHNGKLEDETKGYGLDTTRGWWCRLAAADLDHDGDTDLVVGNLGLNTQYKASKSEPLTITYADFDQDGVLDPIICFYNGGVSYPAVTRDELFDQMPSLQKKFGRYKDYADAQLVDMFSSAQLAGAKSVSLTMLSSIVLRNDGNKHFTVLPLPMYAQMSAANGILIKDLDGDGKEDILLAGNFFPMRVQQGPLDASIGLFLRGDGKGHFDPVPYADTRLYMPGDIRNIIGLKQGKRFLVVAARNNGPVQVIQP